MTGSLFGLDLSFMEYNPSGGNQLTFDTQSAMDNVRFRLKRETSTWAGWFMKAERDKKGKKNIYETSFPSDIIFSGGLVLDGIELLSGQRHWSVVTAGKEVGYQTISPDETLPVALNAGGNSVSSVGLESRIPFTKLYLTLPPPLLSEEGKEIDYRLQDLEKELSL